MRIKVKTLKTLVFTGILAVGAIFVGGMIKKKAINQVTYGESDEVGEFTCNYLNFGTEKYSGSTEISSKFAAESTTFSVTTNGKVYHESGKAVRLGSNKNPGTLTLKLDNYTCGRVIIFAARYKESDASSLTVNSSSAVTLTNDYVDYGFSFNETDTIVISNTGKQASISKIAIRVYNHK